MRTNLTAAERLEDLMANISERCCYAGWMNGTEHVLWRAVTEGEQPWGMGVISEEDVEELRRLAEDAGGWIAWNAEEGTREFVPMGRWVSRYSRPVGSLRWE